MPMPLADFAYIKELVEHSVGNVLEAQRDYVVESRLQNVVEKTGTKSVQGLINKMRQGGGEALSRQVVESLVNNETMFFRDMHPFEILRKEVIPELMVRQARDRTINIWSAACSSGQEPYSLAMLILENFPQLADWQVRIMASDFSQAILNRAMLGRYSQIEANRGLPAKYLIKYFDRNGLNWQIRNNVREMVTFLEVNLSNPWPAMPRMDVMLLRNALIYFDVAAKRQALSQVEKVLKPGGYLFLGAAETTINLSQAFERRFEKAACYQLRGKQETARVL